MEKVTLVQITGTDDNIKLDLAVLSSKLILIPGSTPTLGDFWCNMPTTLGLISVDKKSLSFKKVKHNELELKAK